MNRQRLFWGLLIIFVGIILLMNTLGILQVNIWAVFWPFILVVIGLWFLVAPLFFHRNMETRHLSIPMGNISGLKL